jgi:hypothetical protein
MLVRHHFGEARHVRPHTFVSGVEDVRSVTVKKDSIFIAACVAVPGDMITGIEHGHVVSSLSKLTGNH